VRLHPQNREQQLHKEVLGQLLSLTEASPLMMVYRRLASSSCETLVPLVRNAAGAHLWFAVEIEK
jgi:hypothetical protein